MKVAVIHSQIQSFKSLIITLQTRPEVKLVRLSNDLADLDEVLGKDDIGLLITEFSKANLDFLGPKVRAGRLKVIFYTGLAVVQQIGLSDWIVEGVNCEFIFTEMNKFWLHLWINKIITKYICDFQGSKLSKIIVPEQANLCFLNLNEIYYLERVDGQVVLHTRTGRYFLTYTLDELETQLPKEFYRSHRSFLVNTEKIESIQTLGARAYQIQFSGTEKKALLSSQRKANLIKMWA